MAKQNLESAINSSSFRLKEIDEGALRIRLKAMAQFVQEAASLAEIYPKIEREILLLLQAERMTIYQRSKDEDEIVSRFKTGTDVREIRVPLCVSSIAGYCALIQQPILISDVYDDGALRAVSSQLRFDRTFDQQSGFRTRSVMALPIKENDGVMLGVMQLINCSDGSAFSDRELQIGDWIARIIAAKFRSDLKATDSPYAYLIQNKKITQERLDQILASAAERKIHPSRLLIEQGHATPEEIGRSLEAFYQIRYQPYDPVVRPPETLFTRLNKAYLKRERCVPLEVAGNRAVVAIDDPTDRRRILEVQRALKCEHIVLRVSLPDDILRFLGEADAGFSADINTLVGQLNAETEPDPGEAVERDATLDENAAPIIQLVNRIIADAVTMGASDIHIEPGKDRMPTQVRMRIDGLCREILQIPASHAAAVISRIKIMSRLDISERRKPQDGKCKLRFGGRNIELRVATIPTVNGEGAVMRVLAAAGALPMEKLNLNPENLENIKQLVSHPHGIFLVVGPTGSGKTTTLHAVLGHLNTPDRKIWTAEDPVEITQPGLQQVQVQPKIGFDFAAAMRAFLRADPDIILIGEMRDRETSHIGVEASLTGHLVLSTLHTNSAPETVTRLLDLGLDPLNFADALLGVLAQRLMRTLCPDCKESYQAETREIAQLRHLYGEEAFDTAGLGAGGVTLYRAVGCERCANTGYRGRTGIHELLAATPTMRALVSRKATVTEIRELAMTEGMKTLTQDGVLKILKGQSDLTQLMRVTGG
ncbi:GspE/PulE family protein [Methylocaldum sp.]|uniref:GspE/PulE family protein n=1 Tax=Methylocaldum sp. TaxID=1969727 RepID=UPI002D5595EB|nr:GspE/PulE family protein [Methylocaldum sp.]HYE36389.1 GspE/PulE family protein [Methylocaldum sp.]